jgi:hypothetical protein
MALSLRKKKPQGLSGTWLDFHHPNDHEGDYWNEKTRAFTAEEWGAKVAEMAEVGIDTLVVLSVVLRGKSFYPSSVVPEQWDHACADPLEAVLAAADRLNLKAFLGVGYFAPDTGNVGSAAEPSGWREAIPAELVQRYGSHSSFAGWYLPVEAPIREYFPEEYIAYANTMARHCRSAAAKPVLIAPYGTRTVVGDDRYVEQLRRLEVDFIAYQDEVGVQKTEPGELRQIFATLRRAHDQAGKPLWADVEVFAFEGQVYGSPLVAAPFYRVRVQIESISPYAEKLLCYQYPGMMNPPRSSVFAGSPASAELYLDYTDWRDSLSP